MKKQPKAVMAWTWAIRDAEGHLYPAGDFVLCWGWCTDTRANLYAGGKPSPEAYALRVSIVPVRRKAKAKVRK